MVSSVRRARPAVGQLVEHLVPVGVGPGAGGLRDVADDGHRAVERAAGEHAQLHRRQVLRLVDDDVAVGAHVVVGGLTRAPHLRLGAEQRAGLVEQRHVVDGPHGVLDVLGPRAHERRLLGRAERAAGGQLDEGGGAEQVVEQVGGGEHRPHPLEGLAHLGGVAQPLADLVGLDRDAGAVGERGVHARLDVPAAGVVRAGTGAWRRRRWPGSGRG